MRPFVIVTTVLCRKHQKVIKLELIERIEQRCCFVTFETMPWQGGFLTVPPFLLYRYEKRPRMLTETLISEEFYGTAALERLEY